MLHLTFLINVSQYVCISLSRAPASTNLFVCLPVFLLYSDELFLALNFFIFAELRWRQLGPGQDQQYSLASTGNGLPPDSFTFRVYFLKMLSWLHHIPCPGNPSQCLQPPFKKHNIESAVCFVEIEGVRSRNSSILIIQQLAWFRLDDRAQHLWLQKFCPGSITTFTYAKTCLFLGVYSAHFGLLKAVGFVSSNHCGL